jgi:hypothetical protein
MGLFGPDPKVTEDEYKRKLKPGLRSGFTQRDLNALDTAMSGFMREKGRDKGLQPHEIDDFVKWAKENRSKIGLSDKQLKMFQERAKKLL